MTKHLYIHIPFCNQICAFCDFKRIKTNEYEIMHNYVNKIIKQVQLTSQLNQYETIYLGGGTPNHLPNDLLAKLLKTLRLYLAPNDYEFTIECNPDLVTISQAQIFAQNGINRVSLGVQSTNDKILKAMHRTHTIKDVEHAITNLLTVNITNISCDFIYNLPNSTLQDLANDIAFVDKHNLKHISFYALEIKDNAILNRNHYKIDENDQDEKLIYLETKLKQINYQRYEVSNWVSNLKYVSRHNLAYWQTKDWKALGYGGCGFENHQSYEVGGSIQNFYITKVDNLSQADYYFQIIMMGLRLVEGIDLNDPTNLAAYNFFKDKLSHVKITKNRHLKADNIDLLNDILIALL